MSAFLAILAVIAFLVAVFGLFAPQKVLGWLSPAHRTAGKAFGIYFLLALLLGGAAHLALTPEQQAAQDQALAEAKAEAEAALSDTGQAGEQAANATRHAAEAAVDTAEQAADEAKADSRGTMDQAQDWVTRAANATREGAKNAWEETKEIGSELVEGGQQLWDDAKEAGGKLVDPEPQAKPQTGAQPQNPAPADQAGEEI